MADMLGGRIHRQKYHVGAPNRTGDISRKIEVTSPHAVNNVLKPRLKYWKLRAIEIVPAINSTLVVIDNMDIDTRTVLGHDCHRWASDIAGANTTDTIYHGVSSKKLEKI